MNFDQQKLIADLQRVPPVLRVAFAAACAERQMPAYRAFLRESHAEDPNTLVRALEDVWMNSTKSDGEELQRQLQGCMALIPQEDVVKPWTEQASYAQDAGISVAYVLRTRISGEAQDAAWSAQTAYESLDNFVLNREDVDTNQPGGEARVLSHPLVQAELARQRRDMDELLSVSGENLQQTVSLLRDRAKSESVAFFAVES